MSSFIAKLEFEEYQWDHTSLSPLAMAALIPLQDLPTFDWILKVSQRLLDVLGNDVRNNPVALDACDDVQTEFKAKLADLQHAVDTKQVSLGLLKELVSDITLFGHVQGGDADGRPQSIDDYAELFKVIGLPAVARDYDQDSVFATMRTAGPNPLMLQRIQEMVDHFPVTEAQYQSVMIGDSLAQALDDGRLYICDYQILEKQEAAPTVMPLKYLYAPIALFAAHPTTGDLIPVAIQTQQTPNRDAGTNNLFVADGSYNWLIAKTILEMADGNVLEAISHLGRTHLLIEPFVVATGRNLPRNHPVGRLLRPHFEGTLFINAAAVKTLVAPGGVVEKTLQGTLASSLQMSVDVSASLPFNDCFFPNTMAARDVADLKVYEYRDDALLYWKAIGSWAGKYLRLYYADDSAVASDAALQNWYRDLVSSTGGRVVGFGLGGGIPTMEYLTQAVTMIVFTASVQHAAVNFRQYDLMSYAPNMPLSCYSQFPGAGPAGQQDYLDILPTMARAKLQLNTGYGLGSVYYTELGGYSSRLFGPEVAVPLQKFQADVKDAGQTIQVRNAGRKPYTTLLPGAIPQSINI